MNNTKQIKNIYTENMTNTLFSSKMFMDVTLGIFTTTKHGHTRSIDKSQFVFCSRWLHLDTKQTGEHTKWKNLQWWLR